MISDIWSSVSVTLLQGKNAPVQTAQMHTSTVIPNRNFLSAVCNATKKYIKIRSLLLPSDGPYFGSSQIVSVKHGTTSLFLYGALRLDSAHRETSHAGKPNVILYQIVGITQLLTGRGT